MVDLTNAYAALARGGVFQPWRIAIDEPHAEPQRVIDERVAYVIADILSDEDRDVLHRKAPAKGKDPDWTVADLALLDEAKTGLRDAPAECLGHVRRCDAVVVR